MKLCKKNLPKDNEKWQGAEPDDHYQNRIHILVPDDFDFNTHADEDVSNDPISWKDHYKRLQINFVHAFNIIKTLLFVQANTNPLDPQFDLIGDLSDEQNALAVMYHVYPYSIRVGSTYSWQIDEQKDKENWQDLLSMTKLGRVMIIEDMRKAVGEYIRTGQLSLTQTQEFYRDLYPLTEFYKQSNDPEMKVWICSADDTSNSGYDHSTTGLSTKGYCLCLISSGFASVIILPSISA